jgi:predicted nucleotidyltransferase
MFFNIFINSPEQKILSLFAMNPGKSFYGREISKKLNLSLGSAHAALLSLEKSGLLFFQNIGKIKLYNLESDNPVIKSFQVLNILLVLEPLVESLRRIARRIVLYGSYSEGTFTADSDLDLLIVTEKKKDTVGEIVKFQRKSGLDIRPLLKSQLEWMELEKASPEFYDELSHGIVLWERPIDESGL